MTGLVAGGKKQIHAAAVVRSHQHPAPENKVTHIIYMEAGGADEFVGIFPTFVGNIPTNAIIGSTNEIVKPLPQNGMDGKQGKDTLKTLIRKSGLNYRQLAEKLGIDPGTITRWQKGDVRISLESACIIARELGVSLDKIAESLGYLEIEEPNDDDRL